MTRNPTWQFKDKGQTIIFSWGNAGSYNRETQEFNSPKYMTHSPCSKRNNFEYSLIVKNDHLLCLACQWTYPLSNHLWRFMKKCGVRR